MPGKQIPIQVSRALREKLTAVATAEGTSLAEIGRRALEAYLNPPASFADQLITAIRSPPHWPQIHAALVEQTLALQSAPPAAAPPAPTWTYQRPADAPSRAQPPSVDTPATGDPDHPF
jgi:hypothetical protein